jgi:hypothetical protein
VVPAALEHSRNRVLAYEIAWLGVLAILAYLYIGEHWIWVDRVDGARPVYDTIGTLEVAVLWFGAVGGVFVSLTAIADHRGATWDPSYEQWHMLRPIVGVIMGAIAVLVFQAGIVAAGSSVKTEPGKNLAVVYYIIAFVVGYRETVFRNLLKRVADVILTPEGETSDETTVSPTVAKLNPSDPPVLTISGPEKTTITHVLMNGLVLSPLAGSAANAVLVHVPPQIGPGDVELVVVAKDAPPTMLSVRLE